MNIVVLGAGKVGSAIAQLLSQKEHAVTVVDNDPQVTKRVNDEYDVGVVNGNAAESSVLFKAGISSADVCLAMTGNDEANLIGASMAKAMGARRAVARVYAPVFRDLSTFDYARHFCIDRIVSLENLTALELARTIRDAKAVIVEQFARGALDVQQYHVERDGKLTSAPLREVRLPTEIRVGTIHRNNRVWIATSEDQLQVGDLVTVFNRHEETAMVKKLFKVSADQKKRVVIGGGGETGFHLARMLERERFSVMVFERCETRCEALVKSLSNTVVVHADASQRDDLEEHRVGKADFFVSCTGEDNTNLMQCVAAKDLGVATIAAVITQKDYQRLAERLGIDKAVCHRDVMARQILAFITEGAEISRTKLPGSLINLIEVEVLEGAPICRASLAETDLPSRCLIVAVISQDLVKIPGGGTRLQPGDVAIVLVEEDVTRKSLNWFEPGSK